MLFDRTTHVHIRLLRRNVFFVLQDKPPWLVRSRNLSSIEHVWDTMKQELTCSAELATTIVELRQRVEDTWDNLSRDEIRHLYGRFHLRIHACVASREVYTVY